MGFSFEHVNATDYDELRPTYAPESVRWVAECARLEPGSLVVDLAAGTGQLSRRFASLGARVVAVEPADNMRAVLTTNLPEVHAVPGTARPSRSGIARPTPSSSATPSTLRRRGRVRRDPARAVRPRLELSGHNGMRHRHDAVASRIDSPSVREPASPIVSPYFLMVFDPRYLAFHDLNAFVSRPRNDRRAARDNSRRRHIALAPYPRSRLLLDRDSRQHPEPPRDSTSPVFRRSG
jgi:hypothetical protein